MLCYIYRKMDCGRNERGQMTYAHLKKAQAGPSYWAQDMNAKYRYEGWFLYCCLFIHIVRNILFHVNWAAYSRSLCKYSFFWSIVFKMRLSAMSFKRCWISVTLRFFLNALIPSQGRGSLSRLSSSSMEEAVKASENASCSDGSLISRSLSFCT